MYIFPECITFRFVVKHSLRLYSKSKKQKSNLLNILNTMPKEPKHILEAQKQRIKIKQRSSKYVPGKVFLQIVGTGAKGAPRAVYLFSDQNRYLFNCSEGTQRLAHEHKTKLAKLEHIFVTQTVWKNIGGLPGTALTIQDVGVPQITLHGPPGIKEIFAATRKFVVLRDLKIQIAECQTHSTFEDNVLTVRYVPLSANKSNISNKVIQATVDQTDATTSTRSEKKSRRASSESRESDEVLEDNTDYYAHEHNGKTINCNNVSTVVEIILKENKEKGLAMCYICQLQPRPGALNLDKCVLKGVPPGPLLGKLKNGEDVTLSNGNVIKSNEVCDPDDPGPIFIVVDCPSEDYLDSLITNIEIRKHQKFAENDIDAAILVVHFTSSDVAKLPKYKKWMDDFIASSNHIFVNEDNSCMGSVAVHRIQHKLNMLSPSLFPLLSDKGTTTVECSLFHTSKKVKCDVNDEIKYVDSASNGAYTSTGFRKIGTLYNYHLRPHKGFDDSSEIKLDPLEYINETLILEEFPAALQELKQKLNETQRHLILRDFPKILFLGTGSCIPNKTRNTSAILVHNSETHSILLDCGEGTLGQILRFYGPEKGDHILTNIGAVYISHLHADHHIGLVGLIQGRKSALNKLKIDKEPLYLFAPKQILSWLSFYDKCFEDINDQFILIPNGELILNQELYPRSQKQKLLERLNLSNINTCFVKHCPNAFGVSMVDRDGFRMTYSGDTMPTANLVELGKSSDILIHEATMEDDLSKEAIIKMHSTTSQAIQVGKDMEAKHIILTHFSQRYAKLPRFNDNFTENVGIAFDNMLIKVDELPLVPLLYPALKIMFAEHYEEMAHKAVKRQLKSERQTALLENNAKVG